MMPKGAVQGWSVYKSDTNRMGATAYHSLLMHTGKIHLLYTRKVSSGKTFVVFVVLYPTANVLR